MKDFDITDWKKVCEHIHELTPKKNPKLFKKLLELYPYPVYEGYNIKRFKAYCGAIAVEIHFTIGNICCLGNNICKDCVNHWKTELLAYFNKIITTHIDTGVKRGKIVFEEIIEPYLHTKTFKYESDHLWKQAMKDEIRKGEKNNTPAQKVNTTYIKNEIIPNINNIIENCNDAVSELFHDLIDACKTENIKIFKEQLDTFVNKVTQNESY